jgi:hypothetical protein
VLFQANTKKQLILEDHNKTRARRSVRQGREEEKFDYSSNSGQSLPPMMANVNVAGSSL